MESVVSVKYQPKPLVSWLARSKKPLAWMLCAWSAMISGFGTGHRARRHLWRKWPVLLQGCSRQGAEVYITGDIYYHTAQDMLSDGLLALDPGHHIEVLFVSKLVEKLNQWKSEEAWEIEVIGSQASTNPFYHI